MNESHLAERWTSMPELARRERTALILALCCVWIGTVSAHDAVLVVVHHEVISQFERNPLGVWLIQIGGDEVWLFVVAKLAGTAVVCTLLFRLYQYHRVIALVVAVVLSCFQVLLLVYLHWG